jgi:hypothetical protein
MCIKIILYLSSYLVGDFSLSISDEIEHHVQDENALCRVVERRMLNGRTHKRPPQLIVHQSNCRTYILQKLSDRYYGDAGMDIDYLIEIDAVNKRFD